MGKTRPLSLGVQSNPGRHPAAGAARLINAYAEDAGEEGVMRWPIWCVEGLALFSNLTGEEETPVVPTDGNNTLWWFLLGFARTNG